MDNKFFSFKRFVTFGLGLGMFMSAASGFAQTAVGVQTTDTVIRGKTVTVTGYGGTASLIVDNSQGGNGILMGNPLAPTFKVDRNGTLTSSGSITSGKDVTAAGKLTGGSIATTGNATIGGSLSAAAGSFEVTSSGLTKAGQGLQVNGAGGLTVGAAFKVTPAGAVTSNGINNSDQKITGVAAGTLSTTSTDAVNGSQLYTTNSTVTTNAATAASATALVQTNLTAEVNRATTAEGVLSGRIDSTNSTVTTNAATAASATALVQTNLTAEVNRATTAEGVLSGRIDSTNTALTAEVNRATTAEGVLSGRIDSTNTALTAEVTERKSEITRVDGRIDKETQDRIDGDKETLTQANTYTDSQVQAQSTQDRAYTDNQVGNERNRAMAAEAAISKEVKQVGAMAMAAAAVAGATPTGDKKTAISAAVGGYSGQTAVAVGVTHMVTPMFKAFGSLSKVSGGKTGVAVGGSFSF